MFFCLAAENTYLETKSNVDLPGGRLFLGRADPASRKILPFFRDFSSWSLDFSDFLPNENQNFPLTEGPFYVDAGLMYH